MTETEKIAHVSSQLEKLDREGEAYIRALTASLVRLPTPNIPDDTAQELKTGAGSKRCV
jgi:hypothetical protein